MLRFGLAEAVSIFCKNVQRASGLVIDYQYIGYIEKLEAGLELLIYRSIQELVQNVVKHAAAGKCLVQLSQHDRMLSITVEDNGKGMDTTLLESDQGMGLQHVRQGSIHLNGQFDLQSSPGRGTTINIDIALGTQQAATTTTTHETES
ncbi:sensor histidine kinase [Pedobacter sp. GR22-10]|uniref:sensor histidine kinase n=1 Tax=Pedobacter sp. GR22-10 TaxID=2994472 RepID=UPI002247A4FD|nr:ATP-binding protein [Pedobacter sp. GR22-10]MCX2430391.1 ATP-binding protein [Pedobacter sp. GR22-10]